MGKQVFYLGWRESGQNCVTVNGRPLEQKRHLVAFAHCGFGWGDNGKETAHLAYALISHRTGSDPLAFQLHERLKKILANVKSESWILPVSKLDLYIEQCQHDAAAEEARSVPGKLNHAA